MSVDTVGTSLRLLQDAMSLLDGGWCRGAWARDVDGVPCGFSDDEAKTFSLPGALCHAAGQDVLERLSSLERLADLLAPGDGDEVPLSKLMRWNDAQASVERVIEALERYARHLLARAPARPRRTMAVRAAARGR